MKFLILSKTKKLETEDKESEIIKEILEMIKEVQNNMKLLWELEDDKNPELHFGQNDAFKLDLSLEYKDISPEVCNNKSLYALFKVSNFSNH